MLHPCQKGARGVLSSVIVGGPIIMRLIQIDDCRRLFARSLRICEWRRIIRATLRRSHAALHVGLIFNRRCVQNAGRYAHGFPCQATTIVPTIISARYANTPPGCLNIDPYLKALYPTEIIIAMAREPFDSSSSSSCLPLSRLIPLFR